MVMLQSLRMILTKTVNRPKLNDFAVVSATETIHVLGLTIIHFVALPKLDSVSISLGKNHELQKNFMKNFTDFTKI